MATSDHHPVRVLIEHAARGERPSPRQLQEVRERLEAVQERLSNLPQQIERIAALRESGPVGVARQAAYKLWNEIEDDLPAWPEHEDDDRDPASIAEAVMQP